MQKRKRNLGEEGEGGIACIFQLRCGQEEGERKQKERTKQERDYNIRGMEHG